VLRVGQEVDVYVLGINAQEKKIALSIKRTQAEPWSRVAAAYEVGQLVRGTVTQLANFGAFARIEDGIEGLIHVSELVDDRVSHPKQVVSEGDDLLLRIIRIDPQRRRMGLSLRRALDTPDAELQDVFGPEALQERDELIERIRVRLEAEGIELGDAFSGETSETSSEEPAESAEPNGAPALATVADAEAQPVAEQEPASAASEPPARPAAQAKARKEPTRPAVDLPEDLDGELSAMAMAFAMAGAPADLVAEASDEGDGDAPPDGEGRATE
jgi:small subunit ribosomal protein S1